MESQKFHEAQVTCSLTHAAELLSKQLSPVRYWLHNRIGGSDWYVRTWHGLTYIGVQRPEHLTFMLLKM